MLDEYLNNGEFLSFYFKHFIRKLNSNNVLDFSLNKNVIFDILNSLNCNVININDYDSGLFDGIILSNVGVCLDKELFSYLNGLLNENGRILIIMHINKIDKCFDDETEDEYLKELKEKILDTFVIEEELNDGGSWKFIIILKNTIK